MGHHFKECPVSGKKSKPKSVSTRRLWKLTEREVKEINTIWKNLQLSTEETVNRTNKKLLFIKERALYDTEEQYHICKGFYKKAGKQRLLSVSFVSRAIDAAFGQ